VVGVVLGWEICVSCWLFEVFDEVIYFVYVEDVMIIGEGFLMMWW